VGRRDVVKEGSIVESLQPVGLGEVCIGKHSPDLVQEGTVQVFCHTVVLRCISGGDFMLDAVLLKVLLDMAGQVLAPSIRVEDLHLLSCFWLSL
jgi:hypothetical protein